MTADAARVAEPRQRRNTAGARDVAPAVPAAPVVPVARAAPEASRHFGDVVLLPTARGAHPTDPDAARRARAAAARTVTGISAHGARPRQAAHISSTRPQSLASPRMVNSGRPAPGPGPVVLTRRGRVVVTGFLAVVAAGLIMVLPRGADATGAGVSPGRYEQNLSQVAVRPGDTLWSIAVRTDPSADPRLVVQRITDLNALAGAGITPGQTLWVPKH